MKTVLMVVMSLLLFAGVAYAEVSVNTNGLTESQKAELVKQAETMRAETKVPPVEKVAAWVELGKNAGVAVASCAKELGVAGDKFLESTTGKLVFGMILFKMCAAPLIHFAGGILILAIGVPIWIWSYKQTLNESYSWSSNAKGVHAGFAILVVAAALITMFTF